MPDYINIRTAQNVEISYRLAGLGIRFLAKVIDFVILAGYAIFVGYIGSQIGSGMFFYSLIMLPAMLYSLIFETFNNGQTPGKNIVGSRVISLDGSPLSIRQTLTRWLLLLVDLYITSGLAGLFSVAAGNKQQRLGDMAAGTIVISLKSDASLQQTAFVKVENDYEPVYSEASQLSEQDIRILKTVLSDRSENRFKLITTAASKIENLLNIGKLDSSEQFLKTIIKDYNHYQNMQHIEQDDEYGA